MMEYHCGKLPNVAKKVFELGLKQYSEEVDFIIRYLEFLIQIGDENSELSYFYRFSEAYSYI